MAGKKRVRRATPLGQNLGAGLREARRKTPGSPTAFAVADAIGVHHTTMSRFESGERLASPEHVSKILDHLVALGLELDPTDRETLLKLARGDESAWLAISMPEQRLQLDTLLRLEQSASEEIIVQPLVLPGPLQTPEYARAIMVRSGVPDREIHTRVSGRMGRRDGLLSGTTTARLIAVIDEAVLHRRIGGPEVTAQQLRFLVQLAERPNIELRVIPADADWYDGLDGPFVLLRSDDGPVVHLETKTSGLFLHRTEDVAPYQKAADKLLREAMNHESSVELIAREAEQIERTIQA